MSRQQHRRLAVVGAGPQSLTLLSYLATYRPDLLDATVVIDPDDWLAAWHRQFARYRIGDAALGLRAPSASASLRAHPVRAGDRPQSRTARVHRSAEHGAVRRLLHRHRR